MSTTQRRLRSSSRSSSSSNGVDQLQHPLLAPSSPSFLMGLPRPQQPHPPDLAATPTSAAPSSFSPPLLPFSARPQMQPESPPRAGAAGMTNGALGSTNNTPPPRAQMKAGRPPPVGAIPVSMSLGAVPPTSTPLLASQLGQPVSLTPGIGRGPAVSGLSAHAAAAAAVAQSQLMAHALPQLTAAVPTGDGKVMSRNVNGTIAVTSQPSNDSELQLYRVLQRANLLSYFDTFIAQGGDDVHQLCEAGEEEFLEIMALVGMASKPLHVRRLQKALQEWVQNPGMFQAPLLPLSNFSAPSAAAAVIQRAHPPPTTSPAATAAAAAVAAVAAAATPSSSAGPAVPGTPPGPALPATPPAATAPPPPLPATPSSTATPPAKDVPRGEVHEEDDEDDEDDPKDKDDDDMRSRASSEAGGIGRDPGDGGASPVYSQSSGGGDAYPALSTSPLLTTPTLSDTQISSIQHAARNIVKNLPPSFDTKLPNNAKKKVNKELERILAMSDEDPAKIEGIRRFSAIYGRFDCKRKPEKPLAPHEVQVNEASAQLCLLCPALLTRRDELFPLARQVVRDSGYPYSKGHSRSQFISGFPSKLFTSGGGSGSGSGSTSPLGNGGGAGDPTAGDSRNSTSPAAAGAASNGSRPKMMRLSDGSSGEGPKEKDRRSEIANEIRHLLDQMEALRAAAHSRELNDPMLVSLSGQLELMTAKHRALLQEQSDNEERAAARSGPNRTLRRKYRRRNSTTSSNEAASSEVNLSTQHHPEDDDDDSQPGRVNTTPSPRGQANYVLSSSGGQIIAVQNPALHLLQQHQHQHSPPSTTPSSTASASLLNLSRQEFKQEPSSPGKDT